MAMAAIGVMLVMVPVMSFPSMMCIVSLTAVSATMMAMVFSWYLMMLMRVILHRIPMRRTVILFLRHPSDGRIPLGMRMPFVRVRVRLVLGLRVLRVGRSVIHHPARSATLLLLTPLRFLPGSPPPTPEP